MKSPEQYASEIEYVYSYGDNGQKAHDEKESRKVIAEVIRKAMQEARIDLAQMVQMVGQNMEKEIREGWKSQT